MLYEGLTYQVRGCAFRVYNELGFGHKEAIYQRALAVELEKGNLLFQREQNLPIFYGDKKIGSYTPDFVVDDKVILELKAVPQLPRVYEAQLVHYLKSTNFSLGLLINFGAPKLEIRRKIWTPAIRKNPNPR